MVVANSADKMIAYYPHTLKNKKNMRIAFHVVSAALKNLRILYKKKKYVNISLLKSKSTAA